MTSSWKLLGPMEAVDGIIFAVIQRLIETRFVDLRS